MNRSYPLLQSLFYGFLAASVAMIFIYTQSTASEKPMKQTVKELEEKLQGLEKENDILSNEISLLRRNIVKMMTRAIPDQEKRSIITKVKRVSPGRPQNKDMMVGVTQMMAVWDQLDYILDKLDEITTQISQ